MIKSVSISSSNFCCVVLIFVSNESHIRKHFIFTVNSYKFNSRCVNVYRIHSYRNFVFCIICYDEFSRSHSFSGSFFPCLFLFSSNIKSIFVQLYSCFFTFIYAQASNSRSSSRQFDYSFFAFSINKSQNKAFCLRARYSYSCCRNTCCFISTISLKYSPFAIFYFYSRLEFSNRSICRYFNACCFAINVKFTVFYFAN